MSIMSTRQSMKITTNGKDFKKINNAPEDYTDLVLIAIEKLGGVVKDNIQISFIDLNSKTEISNQKEYDELRNKGVPLKIQVYLKERKQVDVNDINNNINNIHDINEVIHNDKVQEQEQPKQIQMQMSLEEDYKNKLKESLISIITSKVQTMQNELINELSANVNNIIPSNISLHQQIYNNNNMSLSQTIIHKGINCSNCKATDIKGNRYKCISCSNYNLCEICEAMNIHDIRHIFIKIRNPINDNELPKSKLTYAFENANTSYNFLLINTNTNLSAYKDAETITTQVQIKNIGTSLWSTAFSFKCLEYESGIIGVANKFQHEICSYNDITLTLTFNIKSKVNGTYNSLWRMYDNNGIAFGSTVSFTITIHNN